MARIAPFGRQLDPAGPEADGVVASDLARVAAAEDEGEIARGDAPGGRRVARGPREAGVQVSEEFGQKGIGPSGVVMWRRRSSRLRRSCRVRQRRSTRPLASGEPAAR